MGLCALPMPHLFGRRRRPPGVGGRPRGYQNAAKLPVLLVF